MPIMALGTWLHKYDFENQMADAVVYAINKGYKHIDCAYIEGVTFSFCNFVRSMTVKPFSKLPKRDRDWRCICSYHWQNCQTRRLVHNR